MDAHEYQMFLDQQRHRLQQIVAKYHPAHEPPGLFHFTSGPVARSILSSNRLRLYDLRSMSDYTELWRPGRLARLVVDNDERFSHGRYLSLRDDVLARLNVYDDFAAAFGICFTALGDDPGQWHLYGNDGDGFVLELDPWALAEGVLAWSGRPSATIGLLERVSYDDTAQAGIVRDTLHFALDCYDQGRMATTEEDRSWLVYRTTAFLISALAGPFANFKAPEYAREREQRLIRSLPRHHSDWSSIVKADDRGRRYVEAEPWPTQGEFAGRIPLISVRHGPLVDAADAKELVAQACRQGGIPVPALIPSVHSHDACAAHLSEPCECAKTRRAK